MVGVDPDVGSSEFSKFPQPECTCLPHSRTPSWWLRLYKHRGCTFNHHSLLTRATSQSILKYFCVFLSQKKKIIFFLSFRNRFTSNLSLPVTENKFAFKVSLIKCDASFKMAATMMTISHVLDCENELNDNLYNLKMCGGKKNSTSYKVRKILKPLIKLLKKRTRSCKKLLAKKQKTEQQLEVFTEEVDNQNNCNEALEQRLLADLANADNGSAITVCLDGKMTVVPVSPYDCYVPVHFLHTLAGDFFWTTLPLESDYCQKETIITQHQQIEIQVVWFLIIILEGDSWSFWKVIPNLNDSTDSCRDSEPRLPIIVINVMSINLVDSLQRPAAVAPRFGKNSEVWKEYSWMLEEDDIENRIIVLDNRALINCDR